MGSPRPRESADLDPKLCGRLPERCGVGALELGEREVKPFELPRLEVDAALVKAEGSFGEIQCLTHITALDLIQGSFDEQRADDAAQIVAGLEDPGLELLTHAHRVALEEGSAVALQRLAPITPGNGGDELPCVAVHVCNQPAIVGRERLRHGSSQLRDRHGQVLPRHVVVRPEQRREPASVGRPFDG